MKNRFIKNLTNKQPTKDITSDDLKYKIPLITSKKNIEVKIDKKTVFNNESIPIIAGPNGVESRELIFKVGKLLKKNKIRILRGHAFKPLTFPYRSDKYTETRERGIEWLGEAKERYSLPVITEVMEERFLPLISDVADILQIGTRNMQNFPLLTACAKTGKPVMLKRHFGCSLRDWLGAAEYILCEGNSQVLLCERGVAVPHTHRDSSRFLLDLQVVPAAHEITHLPIIVDPSHATFWEPWVKPMALASIACGADGIMVETHPDPKNAAVDSLQPMTLEAFDKLMLKMEKVARAVDRKVCQ